MRKSIHVVEDDEDIRDIIGFTLAEANYLVTSSATALDFKKYIRHAEPDLILMDIRLPDGDALQLCRNLREGLKTREIPVILMSAHFPKEEMAKLKLANDFLSKPFELRTLLKRIENNIKQE